MMVRAGDIVASHDFKLFWQVSASYARTPIDPFSDKYLDEKFLGTEAHCSAFQADTLYNMFLVHDFQKKDNIWIQLMDGVLHPKPFRTKEEKALVRALFL